MLALSAHAPEGRHLSRTDPDPRVRHRAEAVLRLAQGRRRAAAAHDSGCGTKRIRGWRRFLTEGRAGRADRPRPGRPARLDGAATARLETALTGSPGPTALR